VKKLETLGATLVLTMLLTAVQAPGAAAEAFQAASYPVELQGQQSETFTLGAEGLSVSCKTVSVTGWMIEPTEELVELAPTFTECTGGGLAATVKAEGCTFSFDATGHTGGVACPSGKAMLITAVGGNCEVKIGTQSSVSSVESSTVEGSPTTVSIAESLKSIKYTKVKDAGLCPLNGTGEKADGTISGKIALKAINGGQLGLFVGALAATSLCKIAPPCGANQFAVPSTVEAKLTGKTAIEFTLAKNPITVACSESTIQGDTASPPKGGLALPWNATVFSFGTCGTTCTFATITRPAAHFLASGGGNGFFEILQNGASLPTMQVTCNSGKVICLFVGDGGVIKGTVTGGTTAKLVYTKAPMTLLATSDPECGGPLAFSGTYEFKAPASGKFWVTS
jgi:hypothetical protein